MLLLLRLGGRGGAPLLLQLRLLHACLRRLQTQLQLRRALANPNRA
jgi:hypothetical protein